MGSGVDGVTWRVRSARWFCVGGRRERGILIMRLIDTYGKIRQNGSVYHNYAKYRIGYTID